MKREILFRVWDIAHNCYLPEDVYCILNKTEFGAFGQMIRDWNDYRIGEYLYDNAQILEQFMGLTDKNGNKIFEGDILRKWVSYYDSNKADIEYTPTSITDVATMAEFPLFWLENEDFGDERDGFEDAEEWEIIGNIHDNPELITKKQ